jgi:hypothetical protein
MAMDAEQLKKRIGGLTKIGGKRQYTAALKKDVLEYVAGRISAGATEAAACNELELHQATVTGWRKGPRRRAEKDTAAPSRIRRVEIAAPTRASEMVLVLPGGARVEGLGLADIVELARSLA